MKNIILSILLILPISLLAGDPIPGIEIVVEQSPNGITKKATTNNRGEATFSGLKDGDYTITLKNNDKEVVIGKKRNDKVTVSYEEEVSMKPIRLELSAYLDGNDILLRKRPGRGHDGSSGLATGKRQHKTMTTTKELDKSSPKLAETSHNASRSNRSSGIDRSVNGSGDDCDDGQVEITPMKSGRLKIKITCGK